MQIALASGLAEPPLAQTSERQAQTQPCLKLTNFNTWDMEVYGGQLYGVGS